MNDQHIKEVFSNEAFVKELLELETPEEVQAALKEKDIDMTEGEIIALRNEIIKLAEKVQSGEELSLEQMDEVAGGGILAIGMGVLGAVVISSAVTLGGVVAVGSVVKAITSLRW